jgi:hypothetical protein
MEKKVNILFQIRTGFIFLISILFLLACQKKADVETDKADNLKVIKAHTSNSTNVEKKQSLKLSKPEINTVNVKYSGLHKNKKSIKPAQQIFCTPEPVSYPGGAYEMAQFLEKNNSYNTYKYYESIEGIVYLKLLIDTTGKVIGSNILRGVGLGINDEAIRLAGLLKFIPAKDSICKTTSSEYNLNVSFEKHHYPSVIIDTVTAEIYHDSVRSLKDSWHLRKSANPNFIGGRIKMKSFFKKNICYPNELINDCIEGNVTMILKIDQNGKLSDIIYYESVNTRLTEEAIRVIRRVSYWHPAIINHRHALGYLKVTLKFMAPKKQRMPNNDKRNLSIEKK